MPNTFRKLFRSISGSNQSEKVFVNENKSQDNTINCMIDQTEFELRPIRKKRPKADTKMAQTDNNAEVVLEPGSVIRPVIDDDGVKHLVERLYGISVLEMVSLNGYDDRNYKITEDMNIKNPLIAHHCPHGYVLKIMNSMDSHKLSFVEAQNEILNFLNARSFNCPKPIRNVYGHYYSVESISGKSHVVRLLEFIPGELLKDVPKSEKLFYQVGEFVASLDRALQSFNHSGLDGHQHMWMLEKVPDLDKFKFAIKDSEKLELAEEVIEEFKYAVVPRLHELERGVIHGDVNENNLLVTLKPGATSFTETVETGRKKRELNLEKMVRVRKLNAYKLLKLPRNVLKVCTEILEGIVVRENDYKISGVLDFGDCQISYYIFELAIAMTYSMLITGDIKTGGYVLAGYTINRLLPDHEYRLLKTCVCSRLVQSLVLGAYSHEQDPTNTYILSTEKANGWDLLKRIRKTKFAEDEEDETNWKQLADDYLTRS